MPDADGPAPCPSCHKSDKVDAKRRCWRCCDRPCSACGKLTGSAFIELCITCGKPGGPEVRAHVPDGPGEAPAPAKRWVLVFEARGGMVPTSVRMRKLIKSWARYLDLYCVGMPNHVPEDVLVGELEE